MTGDGHTHPTELCARFFTSSWCDSCRQRQAVIDIARRQAGDTTVLVADVVHHDVSVHILSVPEQTI